MSDYRILSHWSKSGLENTVNNMIETGYKPIGNVTVAMTDTYQDDGSLQAEYTQAVIKDTQ